MDLTEHMTAKVAQLGAARAAEQQLAQQLQGVRTHILRLEGAITMLREQGVALPADLVETEDHPDAPKAAAE
jgi:hypothetical protein